MESHGDLMTVKDAAERAGISGTSLLTMVNAGYIKKYKIGKHGFVHYRDVLRGAWEFEQAKTKHGVVNAAKRSK
jgi:excisionase family DNA binding protein